MIESIRWPEIHNRILALQKHDAKKYKQAAVFLLLPAVVMAFVLLPVSLIILGVAAYLFYNARVNSKKQFAYVVKGIVEKKVSYYYPPREPDQSDPPIPEPVVFLLHLGSRAVFQTNEQGIAPVNLLWNEQIKVNSMIYNQTNIGDAVLFLMSPVKDMIGYAYNEELVLLTKKVNGRERSFTIPQAINLNRAVLYQKD